MKSRSVAMAKWVFVTVLLGSLLTGCMTFESPSTKYIWTPDGVTKIDKTAAKPVDQAWDRGYLCTIAEDACIASCKQDHDAEIRILGKYYAWVSDTSEIIRELK